jgi:hypothetical protein
MRHGHSRRHARRRNRNGKAVAALEHSHKRLEKYRDLNNGLAAQVMDADAVIGRLAGTADYREPRGVCARIAEAWRVLTGKRATVRVAGVNRYRGDVVSGEYTPVAAAGGAA